jgi:hypothetical protein
MATRRQFSREFRFEAARLIRESGVSVARAARDLATFMRTFCTNGYASELRIRSVRVLARA